MEVIRIDTVEIENEKEPEKRFIEVIAYTMMANSPLVISSGSIKTVASEMQKQEFSLMGEVSQALLGLGFTSTQIRNAKRKRIHTPGADGFVDQKNELQMVESQGLQAIRLLLDGCNIVPNPARL